MKWLMLRGTWDERTKDSTEYDHDMWLQLFDKMSDGGIIWFRHTEEKKIRYRNCWIHTGIIPDCELSDIDVVFARGGFGYYEPILNRCTRAKKIYYGAGRRFVPNANVKYDLILTDSEEQRESIQQVYDKTPIEILVKPAAECFEPKDVEKEFDICFVANGQQAEFKGVEWLYDNIPDKYRCLHLGYSSKYDPPKNVVAKRVPRHIMPWEYSRCCVGVVPYWNKIDSCPRIIPEMLACDLPVVVADDLRFDNCLYKCTVSDKLHFWDKVDYLLQERYKRNLGIIDHYRNNLSLDIASTKLKEVICDT